MVEDAVARELATLGDLADSGLAASALALAREIDDVVAEQECEECGHVQSWTPAHNPASSKAACARELRETLGRLRELAPPEEQEDRIDEVAKQRDERRRRSAGT